jgi:uracil-DNA glycosylase
MGVDAAVFYDVTRIAIVPMAFCFPGYNAEGSDLPPPPICRKTWHDRVTGTLGEVPLRLIIGGYAQKYHLGVKTNVTETVAGWRNHAPAAFPLPHPSWRNTGWIKRNPWFENELLPVLKSAVEKALT